MPLLNWKTVLAKDISGVLKHPEISAESLLNEFTYPPEIQMGHLALPCFRLGKLLNKPAGKLAMELQQALNTQGVVVSCAGPYLNFKISVPVLFTDTLTSISKMQDRYGSDSVGKGKKIVLEYCSPNIAKRLGFQHIRSTLIGNVLSNVYKHLGFDVVRINFIGDWGTQFARLVAAFELWGDPKLLEPSQIQAAMDHLLQIYVRFHKEVDTNPELVRKASECLQKMERNDPEAMKLWSVIRDISTAAMNKTLKRMNVEFDYVEGESQYIAEIEPLLAKVKTTAHARLSEGAWIVEVPNISTPALIQKKDGTTLYLTRDIAGALDRFQRFNFDKHFYIVSEQQKLHFQQLFGILNLMGHDWSNRCEHLSFGTVLFGAEKMSTREGRVILLDKLLDEARDLALAECMAKNPSLENKEEVAEMVGVGAVIFGELSTHRTRDMEFDWKTILSFEGETGPYVQYTGVRCQSLLEKAAEKQVLTTEIPKTDSYPFSMEEEALILVLSQYRSTLHKIINDNEPYHLTHYLIDLAKAFNRFYYKHPVLQSTDPLTRDLRLQLVNGTGTVIKNGLRLLGITCPQHM